MGERQAGRSSLWTAHSPMATYGHHQSACYRSTYRPLSRVATYSCLHRWRAGSPSIREHLPPFPQPLCTYIHLPLPMMSLTPDAHSSFVCVRYHQYITGRSGFSPSLSAFLIGTYCSIRILVWVLNLLCYLFGVPFDLISIAKINFKHICSLCQLLLWRTCMQGLFACNVAEYQ